MSRSSTPGYPAGRHDAPHGNRARSLDYPQQELPDEEAYDPALVPGSRTSGVGVFQAPRPTGGRSSPPVEPATPMLAGDGTDIDSPFLDLFGGAGPATRPAALPPRTAGREHPPVTPPPPVPPAPLVGAEPAAPPVAEPAARQVEAEPAAPVVRAEPPAIEAAPLAGRPGRTRVPQQPGDRLPAVRPTTGLASPADRPVETPPQRAPRRMSTAPVGEPLTAREAAERIRREATERARRQATERTARPPAERARPEPVPPA
ncbi:hypothetical protein E1166_28135, partial [Micromonospora sp. KC213]